LDPYAHRREVFRPRGSRRPRRAQERAHAGHGEAESALVEAGRFRNRRQLREHGLVILSMGLPYWLEPDPETGEFRLLVERTEASRVHEQLGKFREESKRFPPRAPASAPESPSSPGALWAYALLLGAFFFAQDAYPQSVEARGLNDAAGIFGEGQWWRPLTALCLHGGIGHLAGNIVSGVCFGWLVNRALGAGPAWLGILLAGGLGNLTVSWLAYPEAHRSLGASTAVFAALGLAVGSALHAGFTPSGWRGLRARLIPLAAGIVVLLFLGIGGERTDVAAHLFGFAWGLPLGLAGAWLHPHTRKLPANGGILHAATLGLLAAAWLAAWL